MTAWHYIGLFLIGAIAAWLGAGRCAARGRWPWALTGFTLPIAAGGAWVGIIWVRTDWDTRFLDQAGWLLTIEFVLLAAVWVTAVGTWAASRCGLRGRRRPRLGQS